MIILKLENVINELKNYTYKCDKEANKRIADTCEVSIEDGYAGVIDNELIDTKKHEVYLFIHSKDLIAVPLLYKNYDSKEDAKKYYSELKELISSKNLDEIRARVVN